MAKISIVGVGPGSSRYISTHSRRLIHRAELLIGTERHLDLFSVPTQEKLLLKGNYRQMVKAILQQRQKKIITVLVSGDPGIFSFSRMLTAQLASEEYEIVPGISAVQLLSARIAENWDDLQIISLHGRTKRGLANRVKNNSKVFIYTDYNNTPQEIAKYLFKSGIKKRTVYLGENLSRADERITKTTLKQLKDNLREWKRLCVVLIKK